MKKFILISVILFTCLLLNSCDTPLSEYNPQTEDEKEIVELLTTFQDACNSGDLAKLYATFHDKGVYKSVRGGMVTKSQILETKPEWWSVSGKIQLHNLDLKVNNNEAKVTATAKHGAHFKTPTVFTLTKENNDWLILRVK